VGDFTFRISHASVRERRDEELVREDEEEDDDDDEGWAVV
jgi:hypothetical protein